MSKGSKSSFRNEIDRIIHENSTQNEQEEAFDKIRSIHPHSIHSANLMLFSGLSEDVVPPYDCFTFALDLIDCEERKAAREYASSSLSGIRRLGIEDVLPSTSFLQFLQLPVQTSMCHCGKGDLVVYFGDDKDALHAGKFFDGKIISKWGMKGWLWQHDLWEVPSKYGTSVQFYSHRPKNFVRQKYFEYLTKLAINVQGFTKLVSTILENKGKNLSHEELLRLSAEK